MKSSILTVVTFFLVSISGVENFQYGDMIAFPRTLNCGCKTVTYKHYAIYIGNKEFDQKKSNEDIFHHTGPVKKVKTLFSDCIFGSLATERAHEVDNYLDKLWLSKGNEINPTEITGRINEKVNNCGIWIPPINNCEHLATYVRYGIKLSLQCGQSAAKIVFNPKLDADLLKEIKAHVETRTCEEICPLNSKNNG